MAASAQEKIIVSPFYSREYYDYDKNDLMDARWTMSPFQLRITQIYGEDSTNWNDSLFSRGHFYARLIPDYFFTNLKVDTGSGFQDADIYTFNDSTMRRDNIQRISYSYKSPTSDMMQESEEYSFYVIPPRDRWYATSSQNTDSIQIVFNADTTLFHIRASKPLAVNDDGQYTMTVASGEGMPSFYLFYAPAYLYKQGGINGHTVDALYFTMNMKKCKQGKKFRFIKEKQPFDYWNRIKQVLMVLDKAFGTKQAPQRMSLVFSPQTARDYVVNPKIGASFSLAQMLSPEHSLVLLHYPELKTNTFVHEMIHCYVNKPTDTRSNASALASTIIGESFVEYLSIYLSDGLLGDKTDYYKEKRKAIRKKKLTDRNVRDMIKKSTDNYVSLKNHKGDTSWIYYDLIPLRMHEYAQSIGREGEFARAVADYLVHVDKEKQIDLDNYVQFMESRGFTGVLDNIKTIIPPEE